MAKLDIKEYSLLIFSDKIKFHQSFLPKVNVIRELLHIHVTTNEAFLAFWVIYGLLIFYSGPWGKKILSLLLQPWSFRDSMLKLRRFPPPLLLIEVPAAAVGHGPPGGAGPQHRGHRSGSLAEPEPGPAAQRGLGGNHLYLYWWCHRRSHVGFVLHLYKYIFGIFVLQFKRKICCIYLIN